MKEIYTSATKIVLLIITVSIVGMTWMGIEVTEPLKNIAVMVFAFYFGQKVNTIPPELKK